MFKRGSTFNLVVLITCCLAVALDAAGACDGLREVREATIASIKALDAGDWNPCGNLWVQQHTFHGYPG